MITKSMIITDSLVLIWFAIVMVSYYFQFPLCVTPSHPHGHIYTPSVPNFKTIPMYMLHINIAYNVVVTSHGVSISAKSHRPKNINLRGNVERNKDKQFFFFFFWEFKICIDYQKTFGKGNNQATI